MGGVEALAPKAAVAEPAQPKKRNRPGASGSPEVRAAREAKSRAVVAHAAAVEEVVAAEAGLAAARAALAAGKGPQSAVAAAVAAVAAATAAVAEAEADVEAAVGALEAVLMDESARLESRKCATPLPHAPRLLR